MKGIHPESKTTTSTKFVLSLDCKNMFLSNQHLPMYTGVAIRDSDRGACDVRFCSLMQSSLYFYIYMIVSCCRGNKVDTLTTCVKHLRNQIYKWFSLKIRCCFVTQFAPRNSVTAERLAAVSWQLCSWQLSGWQLFVWCVTAAVGRAGSCQTCSK